MAAVICILAPLSIPIGPIPISLVDLPLLLSLYMLGWKKGLTSCLVYLLLGFLGMPVFSGFSAGISVALGPTGGYLLGFLPMVATAGIVIERTPNQVFHAAGILAGRMFCYLCGSLYYSLLTGAPFQQVFSVCVVPFLPFDLLKTIIVLLMGPFLRVRIRRNRFRV